MKKTIALFLHQFGILFVDDWAYTRQMLQLCEDEDFFAYYDNWGHHESLIAAYKKLLDNNEDIIEAFAFLKCFQTVFHKDWLYTKDMLYASTKIDSTFIESRFDNWKNHEELIEYYRRLIGSDEFKDWERSITINLVAYVESGLNKESVVEFEYLTAGTSMVQLFLTQELRQECINNKTWKSKPFYDSLTKLRNELDGLSFIEKNEIVYLHPKHRAKESVDVFENTNGQNKSDVNIFVSTFNGNQFLGLHKYECFVNKIFLTSFKLK